MSYHTESGRPGYKRNTCKPCLNKQINKKRLPDRLIAFLNVSIKQLKQLNKMKPQEVITIMTDMSLSNSEDNTSIVKTHPELDHFFDRGMYIEKVVQSSLENGKCIITFVFRYYNASQSKID